ncbi:MAG TPA: hypothetical protein DDZ96_00610 [Porphyromonadaceae bacterium]|jgi:hypothetical protein|nr:hypothetical protein [Porphyromonadaceae bacterium]HBK33253.1 hypothetical protein [Porphyromonadaceae bacterium]HBL32305.1 hypothetical protein [Porphyromonadaceae bacterium]HBX21029.1 hypothetical protein [Porphyromonadaceae bacterium]HCM22484.1 hypothetical protein [Porphyromonadaceae bacterium]
MIEEDNDYRQESDHTPGDAWNDQENRETNGPATPPPPPPVNPAYEQTGFYSQGEEDIPPMRPNSWLWQSIVVTILCSRLFGIIGIVNAVQVNSFYDQGKYADAQRMAKRAKTWAIVGIVCGIVIFIAAMIAFMMGDYSATFESIMQDNSSIYNY